MKKRILVLLLGVVLGTVGFSTTASAVDFANGWVGCTPLVVGPAEGLVAVNMTCGTVNGWAALDTVGEDQMLATFLTAMSLGKDVAVYIKGTKVDGAGFAYSKIVGLQLSAL